MNYIQLGLKFIKGWFTAASVSSVVVESLQKQGCNIGQGLKPFAAAVGFSLLAGVFHLAVDAYNQRKVINAPSNPPLTRVE